MHEDENWDEYWALRDDHKRDVPIADLSDDADVTVRRRGRGPGSRRWAALVLVVALIAAGVVFGARASNHGNAGRDRVVPSIDRGAKSDDAKANADVLSALSTTTASGSFHIRYTLTSAPAPNASSTISGEGVVHVNPSAMVTTAGVPGLGQITTRVDGTDVWEDGGANYGMTPSTNTGPGSPLSQFASLVSETLGRREGAIAMNSLASPTGYLDFARAAITAASARGVAVVNGVTVRQYEVTLDTMKALDRPGLTAEEVKATTAALAILRSEGYATTTVQLSIDGLGFIRRALTVVTFDDGGTVAADTTFSEFGCSTVELLPNGPSIVADPTGCVSTAPASVPTIANAPAATATP